VRGSSPPSCARGSPRARLAVWQGATDAELLELVGRALYGKHKAHAGMHAIASSDNRPMTTIGG